MYQPFTRTREDGSNSSNGGGSSSAPLGSYRAAASNSTTAAGGPFRPTPDHLDGMIDRLRNIGRQLLSTAGGHDLASSRPGSFSNSSKSNAFDRTPLSEQEVRYLVLESREIFMSQPMLVELDAPVKLCGDVHGQYTDLIRLFDLCGAPPEANFCFLGDYVDRGKNSLETICLLLAYKVRFPNNFFLLRGNHECSSINRIYGFFDECKRRYSVQLWKLFTDTFNCMPVAGMVEERILCMHGGISPELNNLEQIHRILRPTDVPDSGLICDLLWADPEDRVGWGQNDRGVSWTFGPDVVEKFCRQHDLDMICRAHQVIEEGYQFFSARRLVTVFSAPNYCGEFDNSAAVMSVDADLVCSFVQIRPLNSRRL